MSATSRVLAVMARLGTFTVEDLAVRSGVPPATVHTVLRRHSSFIRGIGVARTGRAGGQPRRYQVDPENEVELLDALAALRADLMPAGDTAADADEFPAELAGDPVWLPLSVPAAESLLLDEFPQAVPDQRDDLLQAAEEYMEHARRALDSVDTAAPTRPHLAAHLELLDFAHSVAQAEMGTASHANCRALLARMPSLRWDVVGAEAQSRALKWVMRLVREAAAREAAKIPVNVLYPQERRLPSLLRRALEQLSQVRPDSPIHVDRIPFRAASAAASMSTGTYLPHLRVLAFDQASVRAGDSARIIQAVAKRMGPMDELVVASEEMDTRLYGQAASHGATFMYLGSSDVSCDVMRQGVERVGERFVADSWHKAFGAALNSPALPSHPQQIGSTRSPRPVPGVRRPTQPASAARQGIRGAAARADRGPGRL